MGRSWELGRHSSRRLTGSEKTLEKLEIKNERIKRTEWRKGR
jgi:hypothetical protein